MAKFTLLEINLDGAQLTANAPFSDGSEHPDALPGDAAKGDATTAEAEEGEAGTKRPWLAALVGLLFLAVLAVLAKKKLGGGSDDPEVGLDEPDIDR
jgi:hypothetical protein